MYFPLECQDDYSCISLVLFFYTSTSTDRSWIDYCCLSLKYTETFSSLQIHIWTLMLALCPRLSMGRFLCLMMVERSSFPSPRLHWKTILIALLKFDSDVMIFIQLISILKISFVEYSYCILYFFDMFYLIWPASYRRASTWWLTFSNLMSPRTIGTHRNQLVLHISKLFPVHQGLLIFLRYTSLEVVSIRCAHVTINFK